ncbi:MAG: T9SS type A sorting domain-containing protein [Melioribacteraceae bacterium]|nr:T9SS type A sorting domain-containing protein [Melioribacteraceae bacterium]
MKKIILVLFLILTYSGNAQVQNETVLKINYEKLPIVKRVVNSGIYCVSHFEVEKDKLYLHDFNSDFIYTYKNNQLINSVSANKSLKKNSADKFSQLKITSKSENEYTYNFEDGTLKKQNGDSFEIEILSRNELNVRGNDFGNFSIMFNNDLAYANLIGIDKDDIVFLIVEKYLRQVPLKISRHVYVADSHGTIKSILNLPNQKYLFTLSDLQIDEDGNLFHLLSSHDEIEIIKWSGLKKNFNKVIEYPQKYKNEIHFNNFTTTKEIETKKVLSKITSASRAEALRIGESYVYHQYYCGANNLAVTNTTAKDGDVVRTPERLIVGMNARVPYKWGGFNTLSQFDKGLLDGKYAGDINTDGVSREAVGVDCSGFVSRCWKLSSQYSTSMMPGITRLYNDWSNLKPGDAIHKIGHVRLYISTNSNGSIKTVESTSAHGWGVCYWSFAPSDLTAYTPRYYTGMENEYYENQPRLQSVLNDNGDAVQIKWICDDTQLLGYRLYSSIDRENWMLIQDESTLKTNSAIDNISSGINYYRVTSIKNNSPHFSESDYSNELAIGKVDSADKYLIVDGFDRESGSWRGDGHRFIGSYGEALFYNDKSFESIKSSELISSDIDISSYNALVWISGDESTIDEAFSNDEQSRIKEYLENGGKFFVSGSEIGWDLDYKGSSTDKDFYNNYLKASFVSDDASSSNVAGVVNTPLMDCNFAIGQSYEEDYPDEISAFGGSSICMKYSNGKGAGINYTGSFGNSLKIGSVIYLAFPLETTANDLEFEKTINSVIQYFDEHAVSTENPEPELTSYNLLQNYPNPFNPATTIEYTLPNIKAGHASSLRLEIFDILGRKIRTLVNEVQSSGNHKVIFNASDLSSGTYFYKLIFNGKSQIRKMILMK